MTDLLKRVDAQVTRALNLLRDGDRVAYFLRGSNTFFAGADNKVEIALPVPADGDFYGDALSVLVDARQIVDGVAEATFRPVDWTTTNDIIVTTNTLTTADIGQVSGAWELLLPDAYSNSPVGVGALFGARHGYATPGGRRPFSVYPSKLEFPQEVFIPRGQTVVFQFTPGYTAEPTPPEEGTLQTEYRISVLFEGHKKVKSLVEVRQ